MQLSRGVKTLYVGRPRSPRLGPGAADNAAITFLSTLVPSFTDSEKYAGGGLTVIANAPNPADQAILKRFFPDGVSALGLLLGAVVPTIVMSVSFLVL